MAVLDNLKGGSQNNTQGFPDYAKRTTLFSAATDKTAIITQDGFVQFVINNDNENTGIVEGEIYINGNFVMSLVDATTSTTHGNTSSLFPVKAGDNVTIYFGTIKTTVRCHFFPLRIFTENNTHGFPDYEKRTTLFTTDSDKSFTIEKDGYVHFAINNENLKYEANQNIVEGEIYINGKFVMSLVDATTSTAYGNTSSLFPVRAGDSVSVYFSTTKTNIRCYFFPFRSPSDAGNNEGTIITGAIVKDALGYTPAREDVLQRTEEELRDLREEVALLSGGAPINITYDGDTSGECIDEFYKVSDMVYPVERLKKCNVTFSLYDEPIPLSSGKIEENNGIITVFFRYSETEVQCIKVTQDGVYFLNTQFGEANAYITSLIEVGSGGSSVSSWEDLEDKPFYDESEVLLEWDGDSEGLDKINIGGEGLYICKISDDAFTLEQIIGANVKIISSVDGTIINKVITEEDVSEEGALMFVSGFCIIANEDTQMEGVLIPKGIWHFPPSLTDGYYVSKVSKGEIKPLDIKFIPDELYTSIYKRIDARIDAYIEEALGGEY